MKVKISNKIYIQEPSKELEQWVKENLTVKNPTYFKKERMGFWNGNDPEYLFLYEYVRGILCLPFGCLGVVWKFYPVKEDYINAIKPVESLNYDSRINLYPYQQTAVERALERKNGILVMPCGAGKGLPLNAKIYTPTGWKRNGDLQVGDEVIGSDGKPTKVTGIYDRGKVDAYKITFSDEVEIVCDKDHLWTVQTQHQRNYCKKGLSNDWMVKRTEDIFIHYAMNTQRGRDYFIPIVKPVEFNYKNEHSENIMNPWLLGFLLGDGCFKKTMITFSNIENDLIERVNTIISQDYPGEEIVKKPDNKCDWRFRGANVLNAIRKLQLECRHSYEKFIPNEYLYGSIETRLAVLQGLFDTDGYINNGRIFEYCTTSKQLADDFVMIVESLGGTAKMRTKKPSYTYNGEKRIGRTAYRIFFKLYKFQPFTSEKHTQKFTGRSNYTEAYRIIKKIEPCKPIISRCITVDAEDQLYVTDHFVVTHNTQTGLELIAQISGRALWLTHTQDLLHQSLQRAKKVLKQGGYGTIINGEVNLGTHITFATVQTMAKQDLSRFRDMFDVVVVDEAAHCAGSPTKVTQFYKVVSALSARYKFGLTATPKRADGLEVSMFALLGGVIHEVTREEVENTTCPVKVQTVYTHWFPKGNVYREDGQIDYAKVVDEMVNDEVRFQFVSDWINSIKEPCIVLANRVEYLKRLCEAFDGKAICLSGQGQSKKVKEERKAALTALNNGEIDCVFASYQLAKEGLDVPCLRYVVFATPEHDSTTVIQSAGRVGRKAEGKEYGTVIDFVDAFSMYQNWYKQRLKFYREIKAEV